MAIGKLASLTVLVAFCVAAFFAALREETLLRPYVGGFSVYAALINVTIGSVILLIGIAALMRKRQRKKPAGNQALGLDAPRKRHQEVEATHAGALPWYRLASEQPNDHRARFAICPRVIGHSGEVDRNPLNIACFFPLVRPLRCP